MLVNNLLYLFTLAALALGQDVDDNDVPSQCRSVCASVTSLTNTCDRQNGAYSFEPARVYEVKANDAYRRQRQRIHKLRVQCTERKRSNSTVRSLRRTI